MSTVLPTVETISPGGAQAEADTRPVEEAGLNAGGSGGPFSGVSGAFIGAGIGIGVVTLLAAAVVGVRAVTGRRSG